MKGRFMLASGPGSGAAYRRRDKILRFEGGYNGMSDHGLFKSAGEFFVSAAHDEADVRFAVAAFEEAAVALRG